MMKKTLIIVLLVSLLTINSALAANLVNTDDTWVREDQPGDNRNNEDFMNARTDQDTPDNDLSLLRFDLTGWSVPSSGISLNLFWYRSDGSTGKKLSLYGLKETDPNETNWSETTVTYNTAPGLIPDGLDTVTEVGLGHTNDDIQDLDIANLSLLVSDQAYGPQVEGQLYTFSGAALDAFLNADTNGEVTFLILRNLNTSSNQARFTTREATTFYSGAAVPPGGAGAYLIPEPATVILLGLGSLIAVRRRKK
jgi:hypothetical protein